ncbi:MAG: phosphoenolpyruvate--protein phosphotransferase [Lentisphaerae bacterium]|nr:phosphoenolpyruvate--protein phosphotransferase [Lentisphaerota bacterium]
MILNYRVETTLRGIPISDGIALAKVCLFNESRHSNLPGFRVEGEGVERERDRLGRAIAMAADQLETISGEVAREIGKAESEIFLAQRMMLKDDGIHRQMEDIIARENVNAESAIVAVLDAHEARFQEMDNEYIRDRASDVGEIKRRLLDILGNMNPSLQCAGLEHCQKGKNRIVVAEELTPTLMTALDARHTLGFVTERGGKTAHAAILARALGIPAISGLKGIHAAIACGTDLLLNGQTGEVVVWPSEKTLSGLGSAVTLGEPVLVEPVPPVSDYAVMANINRLADADEAVRLEADGVGLYRTEFEFLAEGRLLSEDEQFERYAALLRLMRGKPVTFRLLDIGGDKNAPFFQLPEEENPALGLRGSRLLLARPDLFDAQARALARASALGPVNVLYPMIVDAEQFLALKKRFIQATATLAAGELRHGIMFEVPSACLQAEEIFSMADFGSIGTNDLIQYLFAVDRNNEHVSYDFVPDRPALWKTIEAIVLAADKAGRTVSVCGEIAGDPKYVGRLKACGIRSVSVSARLIPPVRRAAAG